MKLRTLFALDAAISVLLALGFLLGPATMLKFLGLTQGKTETLLAQILGAALVGFAVLAWFGRQGAESQGLQGTLAALLSFSAIAFVLLLLGVMAQVTRAGGAWVLVVFFLLLAGGYAYFQFAGQREQPE
jgi:hypothetical protein